LWPAVERIRAFAALCLDEFGGDLEAFGLCEAADSLSLGIDAEAGLPVNLPSYAVPLGFNGRTETDLLQCLAAPIKGCVSSTGGSFAPTSRKMGYAGFAAATLFCRASTISSDVRACFPQILQRGTTSNLPAEVVAAPWTIFIWSASPAINSEEMVNRARRGFR
jgi:hypothetical protein